MQELKKRFYKPARRRAIDWGHSFLKNIVKAFAGNDCQHGYILGGQSLVLASLYRKAHIQEFKELILAYH